ncbi:hypothetical protein [Microbacter margulisiae]|uniref:Uncharacterized protein n=1 Tax=Microbacter margulisiae TaxID=1350067 RepID=A0A7W5H2Y9_9PORP|nr:hypothetical protein [Microbacter margulisiae]MBB3187941.1 hypothetical protein [Microbacter margulisiae]
MSILSVAYLATVKGQVRVKVNFNLFPQWQPASYNNVEYYFLPELGVYYYVPNHTFIYPDGNRWLFTRELPERYRHYDLYSTDKVIINAPTPYLRNSYYAEQYRHDQDNHYQADRWGFKRDNGRHRGWDRRDNVQNYYGDDFHGHNNYRGYREHGRDHQEHDHEWH